MPKYGDFVEWIFASQMSQGSFRQAGKLLKRIQRNCDLCESFLEEFVLVADLLLEKMTPFVLKVRTECKPVGIFPGNNVSALCMFKFTFVIEGNWLILWQKRWTQIAFRQHVVMSVNSMILQGPDVWTRELCWRWKRKFPMSRTKGRAESWQCWRLPFVVSIFRKREPIQR